MDNQAKGSLFTTMSIFELNDRDARHLVKEDLSAMKERYGRPAPSDSGIPCRRCLISTRLGETINRAERYTVKCFMKDSTFDIKAKEEVHSLLSGSYLLKFQKKAKKKKDAEKQIEKLCREAKLRLWRVEAGEITKELPLARLLNRLARTKSIVEKAHPKCFGCGILFGGYHIAYPTAVEGIGPICQWCLSAYKRFGRAKFLKRIKQVEQA